MTSRVQSAHANYFDNAFDQQRLVAQAKAHLERFADQYDVLFATGISGAMVVTLLAFTLGKRFMIVRKPDDVNNHSGRKYEGMLAEGDRILFVDDFISSGRTIQRTLETLSKTAQRWRLRYVGRYEYQGGGMLTWEDSERWGVTLAHERVEPQNTFKPAYDETADIMARQMATPPRFRDSYPYKSLERKLPTFDFETFKRQESETIAEMLKQANRILGFDYAETEKRLVADTPAPSFFHD